MRVFWKYDLFPYVLSDRVDGEIREGGKFRTCGYGGMLVKPLALLNDIEGNNLAGVIAAIKIDRQIELDAVNARMMKRLFDAAPFMRECAKWATS